MEIIKIILAMIVVVLVIIDNKIINVLNEKYLRKNHKFNSYFGEIASLRYFHSIINPIKYLKEEHLTKGYFLILLDFFILIIALFIVVNLLLGGIR